MSIIHSGGNEYYSIYNHCVQLCDNKVSTSIEGKWKNHIALEIVKLVETEVYVLNAFSLGCFARFLSIFFYFLSKSFQLLSDKYSLSEGQIFQRKAQSVPGYQKHGTGPSDVAPSKLQTHFCNRETL